MSRAVVALLIALIPGALVVDVAAAAGPNLTIVPIEWNVVGLDSNTPASGPHLFSIGAKVCNTGDAAVPDASTTWIWDTISTAISLSGAATKASFPLAAGACKKVWYAVNVVADAASFDQTRGFHILASGTGVLPVLTPTPREVYVEHLVSQARNSITAVSGPTSVLVGSSYTYTVSGHTAPGGYGQLVASPFFDPSIFEISSVSETLSVGGPSTTFYTDACGWVNDPTSLNYRSCITSAKAGGTFTATVTATVVGTGTTTVRSVVYDFSGSSYHYNSDFSAAINAIIVTATTPPPNQPPVAVDDSATVAQDSAGGAVTVLGNDSDPDADPLSVTSVTQGTNGTVTINSNGTVSYLPDPGFSGSDSFTYTISDGNGGTATATVTVSVRSAGGGGASTPLPTQPDPQRRLNRVSPVALARTGAPGFGGLAGTGALLVLAGLGTGVATRRRRPAEG